MIPDTRCRDLTQYEKEQMCRGVELDKRFQEWEKIMEEGNGNP
jgi:hypothetical protein